VSRIAVVGAGIVGLAVAARLARRGDEVVVLEKEAGPAAHQTGRNSGVVHSGLYYAPGSLKARLSAAGSRSMIAFAREHGVPVEVCGKLVVATERAQLPRLEALHERGLANGVPLRRIGPEEARDFEPAVATVGALRVESTAIIDYPGVCAVLMRQIVEAGGRVRCGAPFERASTGPDGVTLRAGGIEERVDLLVACAGLQSDRVARASGLSPSARIVPFRGEYFTLREPLASRVRGLIYPVPDPALPFLGVHATRTVGGEVHAGPNAVFALAREGYRWREASLRDLASALTWPGTWRVALRHGPAALDEVLRSLSRRRFARDVSRMLPGTTAADLVPAPAGVRAQAVLRDGRLLDDFLIESAPRQVHVLNAPSPAATCALEIAEYLVARCDEQLRAA